MFGSASSSTFPTAQPLPLAPAGTSSSATLPTTQPAAANPDSSLRLIKLQSILVASEFVTKILGPGSGLPPDVQQTLAKTAINLRKQQNVICRENPSTGIASQDINLTLQGKKYVAHAHFSVSQNNIGHLEQLTLMGIEPSIVGGRRIDKWELTEDLDAHRQSTLDHVSVSKKNAGDFLFQTAKTSFEEKPPMAHYDAQCRLKPFEHRWQTSTVRSFNRVDHPLDFDFTASFNAEGKVIKLKATTKANNCNYLSVWEPEPADARPPVSSASRVPGAAATAERLRSDLHSHSAAEAGNQQGAPKRPRSTDSNTSSQEGDARKTHRPPSKKNRHLDADLSPSALSPLTDILPTESIKLYVRENFVATLKRLVTGGLTSGDNLTHAEKEDNTYHMAWMLPMDIRFSAAVLQTAYDACKDSSVEATPDKLHQILEDVVQALRAMTQDNRDAIDRCLSDAHRLTNDSNVVLTLEKALTSLPDKFTNMSEVNAIFERVSDRITELNPDLHADPARMWKLCVPQFMLDYSLNELKIDHDNPFLPYFSDSATKTSLLNRANAWDFMTQQANQEMDHTELTNLMIKLWQICSGVATPLSDTSILLPEENYSDSVLMEVAQNAPSGTMTETGRKELAQKIETFQTDYGVAVKLGDAEDDNDSAEYGRTVVTLSRDETPTESLMNLLNDVSKTCIEQMANATEDDDKLLAAAKLAMDVTQCRLFPGENINVAMMVINFLRLQHNQTVPFSLLNPDVLDGHGLQEIVDIMKSREG